MRIAYVCADSGVPVFGRKGSSVHVQEVIRAMRAQGATVELFATRIDGDPPPDLAAVRIHRLPPLPRQAVAAREQAALRANAALRAALDGAGLIDLVYERYSLWSYAGMEWACAQGLPALLEVNAPLVEEQAVHRSLVDRAAAEAVAGRTFAAATALLAVSRAVATYLERYPSARGRVHVVPNGVDPDRFAPVLAPAEVNPRGAFTIGFVGTLKPWHGLPVLVEAFARLHRCAPASRLLLVGDGPERAALEADLAMRGLSGVAHLSGAVPPAAVPGLLSAMDVAVAPYPALPDFYFSPLKVYEYMAAARPVVASRIGQLAELIRDGHTGLLCPPGDAGALAQTIDRLRGDPTLRRRLGQTARAAVLREHTWAAVVRRILALAGSAPPPPDVESSPLETHHQ